MQNRSRLQPKRTELEGQTFDSKAEAQFYKLLRAIFPKRYNIQHPYKIICPGKVRDWRIDFGITLKNNQGNEVYCPILEKIKADLKQKSFESNQDKEFSLLLIEFKGAVDIQELGTEKTGRLARLDTNFVSRINHFSLYAPWVLEDLVCIGLGSGGIVTYCKNRSYCVTPVLSTDFFREVVKSAF